MKRFGLLVASGYAGKLFSAEAEEILAIINSEKVAYGNAKLVVRTPPSEVRILKNGSVQEIPIGFFGHTLNQSAKHSNIVATFEQYGKRGALIDLKARIVTAQVETPNARVFVGHSAFSPDKNFLLATEHNHSTRKGEISIRDPETLKELERYSSFGKFPHDCRLIDSGKTLVVANTQGPSNIAYIEARSGKLQHKVNAGGERKMIFSHFDISNDQWLMVGPRESSPHAVLVSPEGKSYKLRHPETDITGVLSVAFIGGDLVAATYPEGNRVQVWNYKTQDSVAVLELPNPRGILRTSSGLLVSLASERILKSLRLSNGTLKSTAFAQGFGGSGSHLVRFSV